MRHSTDIGPFDERFFLYAEECDWQVRGLRRGWRLKLVEDVCARHSGGGSSGNERIRDRHFYESAALFGLKWHGRRGWLEMRAASVLGTLLRLMITAAMPSRRERYVRQFRL